MLQYSDETENFAKLDYQEQSKIMYEMLRYLRAESVIIKKDQIDFREELRSVRLQREKAELNTQQKIEAILEKRFDLLVYFRDRVLPGILQVIVLAILYLVFSKP